MMKPSVINTVLDIPRAAMDLSGWFFNYYLLYKKKFGDLPHGNNQPLLLIPCFLGRTSQLWPLQKTLTSLGYDVHLWNGRFNTGFTELEFKALADQITAIEKDKGRVTIVGHSWGGVVGLDVAYQFPDKVAALVMMCSPVLGRRHPEAVISLVHSLLNLLVDPNHRLLSSEYTERLLVAPPDGVKVIGLHTPRDGIINPSACIHPSDMAINVKVRNGIGGGHTGIVFNTEAMRLCAKMLESIRPNRVADEPQRSRHI